MKHTTDGVSDQLPSADRCGPNNNIVQPKKIVNEKGLK